MENKIVDDKYKDLEKEGYAYLVVEKDGKKFIVYIEKNMPLNVAFDAALDVSIHLREVYKKQIEKMIKAKEKSAK